jgi:hypothetical protein
MTAAGFHIHAGEGAGDVSHDPGSHAMLTALCTVYNLSVRTFLYGTVAYVNNSKKRHVLGVHDAARPEYADKRAARRIVDGRLRRHDASVLVSTLSPSQTAFFEGRQRSWPDNRERSASSVSSRYCSRC